MLEHSYMLPVNEAGQAPLTLEQLWSGLILRIVAQPQFTMGLDSVDILEQTDNRYRRALHFGEHVIHDTVQCVPHESVEFITAATQATPSGRLLMQVVLEPQLSVRFTYSIDFPEASTDEEAQIVGIIKSAYQAADVEMIRLIRELSLSTHH
ncbi:MAG: AtaL-like protein [Formosimonas sp.]